MLREKVNLCVSSSVLTIRYETFVCIWRMVSPCFYIPLLTQESTPNTTASVDSYRQQKRASKVKCVLSRSYNPPQSYIIVVCVWTTWVSYLFKICFNLLLYTLEPNTSVLRRV